MDPDDPRRILRPGVRGQYEIAAGLDPHLQALTGLGLELSGGYRTPAKNRSVGGVRNSWHLQDGGAGALDLVGSPDAMRAGREWALANGAREAIIHDAGTGSHLHTAWADVGQTPLSMTPGAPQFNVPPRPDNHFYDFLKGVYPEGIPEGADIDAAYDGFLSRFAPAQSQAQAAEIAAAGGVPVSGVPIPEVEDLVFTPTDTSGVEGALRGVAEAQTRVGNEMADRRQQEFEVGNRMLVARMLGPELFRLMSGGQFQSRLPEEERLVQELFAQARQAEDEALRAAEIGGAQTNAQIENLRLQTGQADEGRRAQYDQINAKRAVDRYAMQNAAVRELTGITTQIGTARVAAALQQKENERDRAFGLFQTGIQRDGRIDDTMFGAQMQKADFDARAQAALAEAMAGGAGNGGGGGDSDALIRELGEYEARAETASARATDLVSGFDAFFGDRGPWRGPNKTWDLNGDTLKDDESVEWGRIENMLGALYKRQTNMETQEAALLGRMREARKSEEQIAAMKATFERYRQAIDGLEPAQRENENAREYVNRMGAWWRDRGAVTLSRIAEVEAEIAAGLGGGSPDPAAPGAPDPAAGNTALDDVADADLEATVQAFENDAAVADSIDALVQKMPPVGTGLTREQAQMRDRRIAESLAEAGLMIDETGRVVRTPSSRVRPVTTTGEVY